MVTPPKPARRQLSVACGSVPCDSAEARDLLRERLALFGKISFLLCSAHFAIRNIVDYSSGAQTVEQIAANIFNRLHLVACGVFLATWMLARWAPFRMKALVAIDVATLIAIGVVLGVRCTASCSAGTAIDIDGVALLGLTNTVLARAVLVPSTAMLTLLAGAGAAIPVLAGSHWANGDSATTAVLGAWAAMPVAFGAIASRTIWGLRRDVREARQFGQYTIEEKIGAGGMGEVYRARHAMLRRPTALKLLKVDAAGETNLARFEREVQLTSRLTHPNTIAIYDFGRTNDGTFYYAMEYLDGVDLDKLVRFDGPLPAARVIHILTQVCGSLAEAHDSGMVHRDIKPANIILCERGGAKDIVKVVDFGLVKQFGPDTELAEVTVSAANTVTGTPLYLSPEAIRTPADVDARSDLYAVGAVGYFLLTGEHLFASDSIAEIWAAHLHQTPAPPSSRTREPIPADLEGLILMCLEKSRDARPKDARSLAAALERCESAGRWEREDAERWWRIHGPQTRRSAAVAEPSDATSSATDSGSAPTLSAVAPLRDGKTRDGSGTWVSGSAEPARSGRAWHDDG